MSAPSKACPTKKCSRCKGRGWVLNKWPTNRSDLSVDCPSCTEQCYRCGCAPCECHLDGSEVSEPKPELTLAMMALEQALRYDLIKLEFIKVDRLPVIDGKEVNSIAGIPLRTLIYEDEADVWRNK